MTIDINELRRKVNSTDVVDHIDLHANIKPFLSELIGRLEAAETSADWHKRRWMALQMHQTKMREPERTIVCDILANGELMHPTVAGNRYVIKDTTEEPK